MFIELKVLIPTALTIFGLGITLGYWIGQNKNTHISEHKLTCDPLKTMSAHKYFPYEATVILKDGKRSDVLCSQRKGDKCHLTNQRCALL